MSTHTRIVIVGGTSGIAEHCARLWADEQTVDITLVGRDAAKLERVAADLRVRSPRSIVGVLAADLIAPSSIRATVDALLAKGPVDVALIAHGSLPDQSDCQVDLGRCAEALAVNGTSPALWAEAFAGAMTAVNRGTLIVIGSVAGDRGRKSNYAYGAGKGLVTRYVQGLQHRLARTGVVVVLVKPGPTDTPMTAQMKAQGARLASPETVARQIVGGAARGQAVIYAPPQWRLIMWVVRHIPAFVFNRLDV